MRDASHYHGTEFHIIRGDHAAVSSDTIEVFANESRWIAACPAPGCGGAMLANHEDHHFLCYECGNADIGGAWRQIVWPEDRESIEAVLHERPVVNQNWLPGDRIEQLQAENDLYAEVTS